MAKLHELLAVEGNLKQQADKTRADLVALFDKKKDRFGEKVVTFEPLEEGGKTVTEEQLDLQSTIKHELAWITGIWSKALDISAQVAQANTKAQADVVLDDGTVLMRAVPATGLLDLEKRALEMQQLVQRIPTLDPLKGFRLDADRGADIYRARTDRRTRTKKVSRPLQLAPATDKHPAQVQLVTEDVPTGTIVTEEWSGLITPAQKAEMLARAEELHRAFKSARSRANAIEIGQTPKIGESLLKFVFGL